MATNPNVPHSKASQRRGIPTWLLVLLTLLAWAIFMAVELEHVSNARRAANNRGELVGRARTLAFDAGAWWDDYWSVVIPLPVLVCAALAAVRAMSRDPVLRGALAFIWAILLIVAPLVVALASLSAIAFA
jgi:hypothetical protein